MAVGGWNRGGRGRRASVAGGRLWQGWQGWQSRRPAPPKRRPEAGSGIGSGRVAESAGARGDASQSGGEHPMQFQVDSLESGSCYNRFTPNAGRNPAGANRLATPLRL